MANDEHYRKLERMYMEAPCNAYFRPRIQISEGRTELTLAVRPDLFHAAGAVHGSVYFKLMDDAAFFACNSLLEGRLVLTVQFQIHLLRPVSQGEMRAVGTVAHHAATLMVGEARVVDARGREVGRGSGTFQKSRIPLTPDMGYA
jgi:uncharacterized protein (TIGR00369 family)